MAAYERVVIRAAGLAVALAGCSVVYHASPDDDDDDGSGSGSGRGSGSGPCIPADHDEDGDTIPDIHDNCPQAANMGQLDSDGDGVGDVCDPSPMSPGNHIILFEPFVAGGCTFDYDTTWQVASDQLQTTQTGKLTSIATLLPTRVDVLFALSRGDRNQTGDAEVALTTGSEAQTLTFHLAGQCGSGATQPCLVANASSGNRFQSFDMDPSQLLGLELINAEDPSLVQCSALVPNGRSGFVTAGHLTAGHIGVAVPGLQQLDMVVIKSIAAYDGPVSATGVQ